LLVLILFSMNCYLFLVELLFCSIQFIYWLVHFWSFVSLV